jgi:GNAT superfamily N-acetyltransferase
MFFGPTFLEAFDWQGEKLTVGCVGPANRRHISEGLGQMSPASIRQRFHGSKREFTEKELASLTVLDGENHLALGLLKGGAQLGIGVIRMVRSSTDHSEAEVAITVIDAHQRQGLGSFLLDLVLLAAWERGIRCLSFTFLPDNEGVLRLVARKGPSQRGKCDKDSTQLLLGLDHSVLEAAKARLLPYLPVIGTYHS